MPIWDDLLTERDKLLYRMAGHGARRIGFGQKPVLVIIDVTYEFTGDKPESILESIKRFPKSSGEEAWKAIYHIASLLSVAREKHVPIIYTAMDKGLKPEGWLPTKSAYGTGYKSTEKDNEIVREIAPTVKDIVIRKTRASMFFGTPAPSILNSLKADTLLICGGITSGCVRASVTDAFAYNYRVIVIEEAVFDWGQVGHKINLLDMDTKYADVLSITEVMEYLRRL